MRLAPWPLIKKLYHYAIAHPVSFFFYLLLFFIPLVLFPKTSELFEFNKMVLTYVLTTIIVSTWVFKMALERKIIFRRTILDIPLLIFLGSQFLSTLVSFDERTSFFGYYSRFHGGLASSVSYGLLYWAYVSNMDRKKTKRAIYFLLASAVLVSVYGVLEHFGIDKDIWVQDVQNRVFSTLGQPNWLAAWLVALMPITWGFALISKFNPFGKSSTLRLRPDGLRVDAEQSRSIKIQSSKLQFKVQNFWIWTLLSSLFFITLLYTKSRSGLLGFLVADFIFWTTTALVIFRQREKLKILIKKLLIFNFAFLIVAAATGTPWTPSLLRQPTTDNRQPTGIIAPALEVGGTESADIRKIVWRGAIDIWKAHPVLGSGVETFAFSYYNFRPKEHNLVSEWDFLYNKAHNEYLNLAATTGTLGLASYLALIGTTTLLFLRKIKKSIWAVGFLSGYLSILVTNFFGFSVVPVALQFFLYPAMVVTLVTREKKKVMKDGLRLGTLAPRQKISIGILILVASYLLVALSRYWYADILYLRGKLENDRGNYEQARGNLQKATNLSAKEAIYWDELSQSSTGLALALFEAGDEASANNFAQTAIAESDKAISLSPRNVNLLRNRASLFIKLSAFNSVYLFSAKEVIVSAITLAPTDAKLHYNLGLTYARIGEIESAIETLEKTVKLKPNYANARLALGLLYADRGEIKKAKAELEYILEKINPQDELVRQQLEELSNK